MAAERTIAIIGKTASFCPALTEKLAKQNLHLLLISNEEEQNLNVQKQLENKDRKAKIEFIHCEKEGCWEADIIAFLQPEIIDPKLIQRIKNVATQKIVLIISEGDRTGSNMPDLNFNALLPHSRVVNLVLNSESMEVEISGKDKEAKNLVKVFFKEAGFKV